jgi:hypothetical protein
LCSETTSSTDTAKSSKLRSSPKERKPRTVDVSFFQYAVLYVKARGGEAARSNSST